MQRALTIATLLIAGACGTVATQAAPPRTDAEGSDAIGLFPSDSQVLGDEDIARILDARWKVPEHVRIALLPLRQDSVFVSGYFYRAAGQQTAFRAVDELRKLPFVYDVSYLPDFLLPADKTVSLVREAAARYQADWVLVYSTTVSADEDYKLLARDEVHARCLVECALLDTRSGLIPFTARSTEELHVKQGSKEDMPALVRRAEQEAVDAGMLSNARSLIDFLARVDRQQ